MRFPIWLTVVSAVIGLILVLGIGAFFLQPPTELILSAGFDSDIISPNADQDNDITGFQYELARNATITISFENETGETFYFRQNQQRTKGDYRVLFSGVVDGYLVDGEDLVLDLANDPTGMAVERRLMPDGVYTWRLIAENDTESEQASGTFTIQNSDSDLPLMTTFTISGDTFTPNRDGVSDRVTINIFVEKDADLRVFLLTDEGVELPIAERQEWSCSDAEDCGRYAYDYEGGVDLNQLPPPDGTYTVVALAQDAEGQRIRRETTLTIVRGGVPRAEISPQAVDSDVFWMTMPYDDRFFSDSENIGELIGEPEIPDAVSQTRVSVPYGDMLVFRLTVNNYSDVPIRTTMPPIGTVYGQDQRYAAIDALQEAGAWRVGVMCDTTGTDFPYRWAIADSDELVTIRDEQTGQEFQYLPANTSTVVWGAIRMTEINEFANPQTCWAGLIHEGVDVSVENRFVGPIEVEIGDPPTASINDD
ncbi:MAG: hypothetical protein AAFV93_20760 [Chloroflexota bacterium]